MTHETKTPNYIKEVADLINAKNWNGVIQVLQKMCELDPTHSERWRWEHDTGVAYSKLSDYQSSLSALNRAIKLKRMLVTYTYRGAVYGWMRNYQKALIDFNYILAHNPRSATAYASRGGIYASIGLFEASLADLSNALHLKLNDKKHEEKVRYIRDRVRERVVFIENATKAGMSMAEIARIVSVAPTLPVQPPPPVVPISGSLFDILPLPSTQQQPLSSNSITSTNVTMLASIASKS